MARAIVGVIVGYFVMMILVFLSFSGAYLVLGADGAFQPRSYEVSPLWIVLSIVLGLVAAVAGGYVCALISKLPKPPLVLALVVVILGVLSAIPVMLDTADYAPRTADVPNVEAMMFAKQPVWVVLWNPVIGAVGVLLGARLRRTKP